MKKLVLATLLFAALLIGMGQGQGAITAQTGATATPAGTPAATTTGPSNDSQGTLFVCADSVILDFTGTSLVGWDIYYQVFSGTTGSGTAITNLRQVPVAGIYAVSDKLNYNSGITVAAGGSASAKVDIARESDPTRIDFSYVLTDTQDGCGSPSNTLANGEDVSGAGGSTGTNNSGTAGVTTHILAPGGVLNPNLQPEAAVVVGARLSDRYRSTTPGLIFAQCDSYPLAEPGIVYDTDTVTIFWSWFTKTEAQMADELASAIYKVKFNNADLPMTQLSAPVQRDDGNFWVFYTATVGNLRPGHYEVGFEHTWRTAVNDGYADYGPGTTNPREAGICNFDVLLNPDGKSIEHTGMYFPSNYPIHALPTPIP